MRKLIVILFLLFAVSASAQGLPMCPAGSYYIWAEDANDWKCSKGDVVAEAKAKLETEDRKALVKYAAELLHKVAKYQRKVDDLKAVLSKIENGELKAHQIPKNCEGCITIGSSNTSLVFVDN